MIECRDLRFAYDGGEFNLHVDRLEIGNGERVAWVGASGAGKTTLLHLVAGIITPTSGTLTVGGIELTSLCDSARRDFRIANIGLAFQDFALLDYLSVLDNILLPFRINRTQQLNASARNRARELAEEVGLAHLMSRRPSTLSQGERQRVAVCRALVANPQLVLTDEPTANLDESNSTRVLDTFQRYAESSSATLVVVTHDPIVLPRVDRSISVDELSCNSVLSKEGTEVDG